VLSSAWPQHAAAAAGVQRKTICISTARLLCECPEVAGEPETFSALLTVLLLLTLTLTLTPPLTLTLPLTPNQNPTPNHTPNPNQLLLLLLLAEQGMAVGAAVDLNAEEEESPIPNP